MGNCVDGDSAADAKRGGSDGAPTSPTASRYLATTAPPQESLQRQQSSAAAAPSSSSFDDAAAEQPSVEHAPVPPPAAAASTPRDSGAIPQLEPEHVSDLSESDAVAARHGGTVDIGSAGNNSTQADALRAAATGGSRIAATSASLPHRASLSSSLSSSSDITGGVPLVAPSSDINSNSNNNSSGSGAATAAYATAYAFGRGCPDDINAPHRVENSSSSSSSSDEDKRAARISRSNVLRMGDDEAATAADDGDGCAQAAAVPTARVMEMGISDDRRSSRSASSATHSSSSELHRHHSHAVNGKSTSTSNSGLIERGGNRKGGSNSAEDAAGLNTPSSGSSGSGGSGRNHETPLQRARHREALQQRDWLAEQQARARARLHRSGAAAAASSSGTSGVSGGSSAVAPKKHPRGAGLGEAALGGRAGGGNDEDDDDPGVCAGEPEEHEHGHEGDDGYVDEDDCVDICGEEDLLGGRRGGRRPSSRDEYAEIMEKFDREISDDLMDLPPPLAVAAMQPRPHSGSGSGGGGSARFSISSRHSAGSASSSLNTTTFRFHQVGLAAAYRVPVSAVSSSPSTPSQASAGIVVGSAQRPPPFPALGGSDATSTTVSGSLMLDSGTTVSSPGAVMIASASSSSTSSVPVPRLLDPPALLSLAQQQQQHARQPQPQWSVAQGKEAASFSLREEDLFSVVSGGSGGDPDGDDLQCAIGEDLGGGGGGVDPEALSMSSGDGDSGSSSEPRFGRPLSRRGSWSAERGLSASVPSLGQGLTPSMSLGSSRGGGGGSGSTGGSPRGAGGLDEIAAAASLSAFEQQRRMLNDSGDSNRRRGQ